MMNIITTFHIPKYYISQQIRSKLHVNGLLKSMGNWRK